MKELPKHNFIMANKCRLLGLKCNFTMKEIPLEYDAIVANVEIKN